MAPPSPLSAQMGRLAGGPLRAAAACAVLLWLAARHLPFQFDDFYITAGFARQWAETGELAWTSGERVEGFSSLLHVILLRCAMTVGADVDRFAKATSLLAGCSLLVLFHRRLPRDAAGAFVLTALTLWAPLAFWSAIGAEITLFALLVSLGWMLVGRAGAQRGAGAWLLWLAALTRPEGTVHLLAAAALRLWRRDRWERADAALAVALGCLAAYHGARAWYFGSLWSTPALVKVAASRGVGVGLAWIAIDAACAAAIVVSLVATRRLPRRTSVLVAAPLAIQAIVLLRANGDWMGVSRLLLPGIVASALLWIEHSEPRRASRVVLASALAVALVASATTPASFTPSLRRRSRPPLAAPWHWLDEGLGTPDLADVEWIVRHLPDGATVLVGNAGMVGNVPGIRVHDAQGLVDRDFAELSAGRAGAAERIRARLTATPLDAVRRFDLPREVEALLPQLPRSEIARYDGGPVEWLRADDRAPSAATVEARWAALADRFPSQPWLAWQRALAAADRGAVDLATELARAAAARAPLAAELADAPASLAFTGGDATLEWRRRASASGFVVHTGATLITRPLTERELATGKLAFASPAASRLEIRWVECAAVPPRLFEGRPADDDGVPLSPPCAARAGSRVAIRDIGMPGVVPILVRLALP